MIHIIIKLYYTLGVPEVCINDDLKDLLNDGKKVQAIKNFRIVTGIRLKEAKEYVDSLEK